MALASSGITVSAVKTALGSSNDNVGGLCSATNINPWSVWKPISLDAVTLTRTLIKNANYGITLKYATTASATYNAVKDNGNVGYTYNKPTGISTSPYRLGDFRNYNHNAIIPITAMYNDGDEVKIGGVSSDYSTTITGLETPIPDDLDSVDYLTRSHIYPSTVTNRGALITDGTNTYWSVGSIPWGNSLWQKFKGKTVTVFEFMTNLANGKNSSNYTTTNSTDRFYSLPFPIHTITVSSSSPSGSKIAFPQYNYVQFTSTTYATVEYSFNLSAVGDVYSGGTITNFRCGICSDKDGVNIIQQKNLIAPTIPVEGTTSNYTGNFTNTGNSPTVYFCIWYNNKLQHTTLVMQKPTQ